MAQQGSAMSWEHWDTDSIPGPAQRVTDPVLLQVQLRSCLWLRSDSWPGNSLCRGVAKNGRKKNKKGNLDGKMDYLKREHLSDVNKLG